MPGPGPLVRTQTAQDPFARRRRRVALVDVAASVIDWRFQHYVTPWIIRAVWVAALVVACVYCLVAGGLAVYVGITAGGEPEPSQFGRENPFGIPELESDEPPATSPLIRFAQRVFGTVFAFLLSVSMTFLGLVVLRVYLEIIAVLFNIAATLAAMRSRLDQADSQQRAG
ncbi:MAG: DUF4282 domain-containing protein [Pirellulales bacterium]